MSYSNTDFEAFLALDDIKSTTVFRNDPEALAIIEKRNTESTKTEPEVEDNFEDLVEQPDNIDFKDTDWEDLLLNGFDDEKPEETDETTPEETTDDSVGDEEFEYDEEPVDVDLDTLVSLPSGETLTIEDLQKGFLDGTAIQEQRKQVMEMLDNFSKAREESEAGMALSELEADKTIASYRGFDWARLAKEDPAAYVKHKEFLEATLSRKENLINEMRQINERKEQQEYQQFVDACTSCRRTLEHEVPGWNEDLYQELMEYAVQNGADEADIVKENRPSYFKMILKAKQFDEGKSLVAKAKIKRVGKPSKVSTGSVVKGATEDKTRRVNAYNAGKLSNHDVFDLLDD